MTLIQPSLHLSWKRASCPILLYRITTCRLPVGSDSKDWRSAGWHLFDPSVMKTRELFIVISFLESMLWVFYSLSYLIVCPTWPRVDEFLRDASPNTHAARGVGPYTRPAGTKLGDSIMVVRLGLVCSIERAGALLGRCIERVETESGGLLVTYLDWLRNSAKTRSNWTATVLKSRSFLCWARNATAFLKELVTKNIP